MFFKAEKQICIVSLKVDISFFVRHNYAGNIEILHN